MQPKFIKSLIERKRLAQAAQHISPVGVTLFVIFAIIAVQGAAWFNRRLSDSLIETWVVVWMLIAVYLLFAVKVASQWEKVIVLRLGKFQGLKGPGFFWIIPIIDTTAAWIDHRVNVTPFSAEKTLTKDTVPVDVDAVLFWVVWDAEKAALEVADYNSLRRLGLEGTELARAQCGTIRLKLLKIGALIRVTVRKIWVSMAGGYPYAELWARIWSRLQLLPLKC